MCSSHIDDPGRIISTHEINLDNDENKELMVLLKPDNPMWQYDVAIIKDPKNKPNIVYFSSCGENQNGYYNVIGRSPSGNFAIYSYLHGITSYTEKKNIEDTEDVVCITAEVGVDEKNISKIQKLYKEMKIPKVLDIID